jgi:transcriptional regulator with XRE-family HTH domain
MFLVQKFKRSNMTIRDLAVKANVGISTAYRWVHGEHEPQARFHPRLRQLGLWEDSATAAQPAQVEQPALPLSVRARVQAIRDQESSAVSEAIEKVRQSFATKYEAVQKGCIHPESFLTALRAPQGLLYVQFCKECGWEIGRE